jgi:mannose-6-phosphate isomerase-like protein (cupin superfamily)
MNGFVDNIESLAIHNTAFHRVLYTGIHCQLVLKALKPNEETGEETHHLDQFFRVEAGFGEATLDGVTTTIKAGFAVLVPAGTQHNIVNTGHAPLKLFTFYAPPNPRYGAVNLASNQAETDNDHFDSKTTELPN